MYAIIATGGKQYKVSEGDVINVEKIEAEVNDTVTFDDVLVVHNVKVIEGKSGLFVAMPSRQLANGEYKDVVHPITSSFRTLLQDKILSEYNAGHFDTSSDEF